MLIQQESQKSEPRMPDVATLNNHCGSGHSSLFQPDCVAQWFSTFFGSQHNLGLNKCLAAPLPGKNDNL